MFKKFLSCLVLFSMAYQNALAFSGDLNGTGSLDILSDELEAIEEIVHVEESSTGSEEDPETSSGGQEENTNSGSIDIGTAGVQEEEQEDFSSRFKLVFQNPSYVLDRDIEKDSYICDESKEECKINFNIEDAELSGFSTKFYCENNFSFTTGEEQKCNPGTIVFPTGEHDIVFEIFKKEDDSLVWERAITIINQEEIVEENTGSGGVDTSSGSIDTGSGITGSTDSSSGSTDSGSGSQEDSETSSEGQDGSSGGQDSVGSDGQESGSGGEFTSSGGLFGSGEIDIPLPIIEVQSGLDFLTGSTRQCKNQECKINLTGVSSFTGGFLESDYACLWNFSGGVFTTEGTESKCNPGYVDYGTGTFEISFRIWKKDNSDIFREELIFIENLLSEEEEGDSETGSEGQESGSGGEDSSSGGGGGLGGSGGGGYIDTDVNKKIIVQSGLDYINGKYICDDEKCKINLEYPENYKETCRWSFGGGEFKDGYTETCNPGFIYFPPGRHSVGVRVFKGGVLTNSQEISFENVYLSKRKANNIAPTAKITLQGRLAKYKQLVGNKIICKEVEECPVNLTGEDSYDPNGDKLIYNWYFGNGQNFDGKNPKSVKFTPGSYKVTLKVTDIFAESSSDDFFVEVIGDTVLNFVVDENVGNHIKISGVLPNNSGVDDYEWVELINNGEEKVNLKGLQIDDIVGKGSKPYAIDYDLYINPFSKKRFYKSKTKITFGNTSDEANLVYNDELVDSLKWDFKVPDDFVLNHENINRPFQKVLVVNVVDGDTIDIQFENGTTERVRLIGVDTPETKHPKKPVEEFGIEASLFTKKTLLDKYVYLELGDQDRGKYGRLLGYIHLDKEHSFNELLIEKGYARAYLKYPFKYSKKYAELEKIAKKNKIGLWADEEIVEQIKLWEQEDKLYLEELEKQELYDLSSIFEGGFSLDTLRQKSIGYQGVLEEKIDDLQKSIALEPKFVKKWLKPKKQKDSLSIVKDMEKTLKKSISYRVSKQKKGLKISGTSDLYKNIVLNFGGEKINLSVDDNGKFSYYTRDLFAGVYAIELIGVDSEVGDIFLKNGRDVELTQSYVSSVKNYSTKRSSTAKKTSTKSKIKKLNIEQNPLETISVSDFKFKILLNIIIGLITIIFTFIIFRRKNILQNI